MTDLNQMNCVALSEDSSVLTDEEISTFHSQIPEWHIREVDGIKRLERVYKFKNFTEALSFTNEIGAIAEEEDHHPLIITEWGKVTLQWWSHKIGGLHDNDFIMAAKSDEIYA